MHRYTFYAICLIAVTLLLSTVVPHFSIMGILVALFFFSSSQDRKPTSYTDYQYSAPIENVPPRYYDSYREYLSSDKWRDLRSIVLLRDSHTCQDCGATTSLQVHHLHYDGIDTMTFTTDQLITVCSGCHDIRHS